MTRNNRSARSAGQKFERATADHLAATVDDRIDIRPKNSAKDRGDIGGIRHLGMRVVLQCKNTSRTDLGAWRSAVEEQAGNDDADIAAVVHKRHGVGTPGRQWVTMTLDDLALLLGGEHAEG